MFELGPWYKNNTFVCSNDMQSRVTHNWSSWRPVHHGLVGRQALCNLIQEQLQPLPAGCRPIFEVVATQNRGKGPILDMYICVLQHCKSAHSHLGPMGAIWLRVIMTCIFNAYHTHNLSQTLSYLLSEEWKPLTDFQRCTHINSHSRQLHLELANDMQLKLFHRHCMRG